MTPIKFEILFIIIELLIQSRVLANATDFSTNQSLIEIEDETALSPSYTCGMFLTSNYVKHENGSVRKNRDSQTTNNKNMDPYVCGPVDMKYCIHVFLETLNQKFEIMMIKERQVHKKRATKIAKKELEIAKLKLNELLTWKLSEEWNRQEKILNSTVLKMIETHIPFYFKIMVLWSIASFILSSFLIFLGFVKNFKMDPNAMCNALHAVKMLRLEVGELFSSLNDGLRDDHGEDSKENKFLMELQDMVTTVFRRYRELDQLVTSLTIPASMPLYNSSFLTQESTADRQALYSPLVLSHKWTDKIHTYSSLACTLLSENNLKKAHYTSVNKQRKRPPTNSHNIQPQQMDAFLSSMDRLFPDMSITVSRPFASNVVMQVTLGRVLQALITFKGIMIEWVVIKGYNESCNTPTDLLSESKYHVFRRISDHCHTATLHFASPTLPEIAARSFITWLNSYVSLFTATCKHCNKYIHDFYPPTWRDFRSLEPYHFECKP